MDADVLNDLLYREQFYYADCIVIGKSRVAGYRIVDGRLDLNISGTIDETDITDIFKKFSVNISGSTYVGGEASAHGSCGFFYKKTGDVLDWALMSLESDPFISVEKIEGGVAFISNAGHRWIVHADKIRDLRVET